MRHLILGAGEIGSAYYRLLLPRNEVFRLDVDPKRTDSKLPKRVDVLHICLRYSDKFLDVVRKAIDDYGPDLVNNMATCPPRTTEHIDYDAVHSTTRGLHPNLEAMIRLIPKHYGGPKAKEVAELFGNVCEAPPVIHDHAKTTELLHIASNYQYLANIMAADDIDSWCRYYGVDFYEFQRYSETHNQGFREMGLHSKMRPIVYPSGGHIGGHCVKLAAELLPKELHTDALRRLADYA